MNHKFVILSAWISIFSSTPIFAYDCPTPPISIAPEVEASVSQDKTSGLYTYKYTVKNKESGLIPINRFNVMIDHKPVHVSSPAEWMSDSYDQDGKIYRYTWSTASRTQSIAPGKSKGEFTIESEKSPGIISFSTYGKTELLRTTTVNGDEEASPDCPGYFVDLPLLDRMVSGVTEGPVGDARHSVKIKLMDKKGERDCGPVSPYEDKGILNVFLQGKKDLDVKDIDLSTLRFGIGKAPLLSSKSIGKSNSILLQFDIEKVAIECGRDRVLFLSGKMKDGKELLGGAEVKTKNCDKDPKRKKHAEKDHKPAHKSSAHKH